MPKIMGHRGAKAYEPENTLRSVRKALDLGVQAVEIDIHLSRDGRLIVIHDATVDRTTNGKGRVSDQSWKQLRRLDAGLGEPLPVLEEVVALVRGPGPPFYRAERPEGSGTSGRVFSLRTDLFAEAHVISFWHPCLKELRQIEPRILTGVLFVGCPVDPAALAAAAEAEALALNYQYVTPELVQAARKAGLGVAVWNIDTVAELLPVLPLEVDYVGSNAPDILLNYLQSKH